MDRNIIIKGMKELEGSDDSVLSMMVHQVLCSLRRSVIPSNIVNARQIGAKVQACIIQVVLVKDAELDC